VLGGCLASAQPAPPEREQLMVDSIRRAPGPVVLIATGPLSNVAAAARLGAARPHTGSHPGGPHGPDLCDGRCHQRVRQPAVHDEAGFDGSRN